MATHLRCWSLGRSPEGSNPTIGEGSTPEVTPTYQVLNNSKPPSPTEPTHQSAP